MKIKPKTPEEIIICTAMLRQGIDSRKELSERTGIEDQRTRERFKHFETTKIYEFRAMQHTLRMSYSDLLRLLLADEYDPKEAERTTWR